MLAFLVFSIFDFAVELILLLLDLDESPAGVFLGGLCVVTAVFLIAGVVFRKLGITWNDVGFAGSFVWKGIGDAIFWGIAIYIISLPFSYISGQILAPQSDPYLKLLLDSRNIMSVAMVVMIIVVLVPVATEILFRGILQTALRGKLRLLSCIFTVNILFAAIHVSPGNYIPVFVAGALLSWFYEKRRSLILVAVASATWHMPAVILTLFTFVAGVGMDSTYAEGDRLTPILFS